MVKRNLSTAGFAAAAAAPFVLLLVVEPELWPWPSLRTENSNTRTKNCCRMYKVMKGEQLYNSQLILPPSPELYFVDEAVSPVQGN